MGSQKIPLLFVQFLIIFFISLNTHFSFATDSITINRPLSGDETIISDGGKFVLGFFRPHPGNSFSYIGIWYMNGPTRSPVWVANRETPVTNTTTSELKMTHDGKLVLLDQSKTQIWSTNLNSTASISVVAVLLESGTLVLRDGSDPNKVFWHSCDHPTDTWLPGCYLGLNKLTGSNRRLISWKNAYDPSPGLYSLEVDSSTLTLLWNNTTEYWTSGNWDGDSFPRWLENGWPGVFKYKSNAEVNYFSFLGGAVDEITMDHSGQLKGCDWDGWCWSEPENKCDIYAICGPFGSCMADVADAADASQLCYCPEGFSVASPMEWDLGDRSSGCVRDEYLQCGNNDRFYGMHGMISYESPHRFFVANASDCEVACLNNCSCVAYSPGTLCSVWYGDLLGLKQSSYENQGEETLYLRMGPSNLKGKNGNFIWEVLSAVVGLIVFLVVIIMVIWRCQNQNMTGEMKVGEVTLVLFTYRDLQKMTRNFSERLGGGGFGTVFKGALLHDSTGVAVKKLEGILQGDKQFRSEVSTIGVIQHVNLVRLLGFCSEGKEKLLVYEYMPNGALDSHLFRSTSMVLDWKTRYQIALGTARGLSYLHEQCRDCIIHCDIKPENILLDASFLPKVADFGLAKNVDRNFDSVLTTLRGTIGYIAPEWISGGTITAKADVYSYGMMLLEIISGRRNIERLDEGQYFPILAAKKVVEGDVLSLLDTGLEGDIDLGELSRACKVACWCIQDNEVCRLSMGEVVHILEGVTEVNIPPIPKLLQALAENIESLIYFSDGKKDTDDGEIV